MEDLARQFLESHNERIQVTARQLKLKKTNMALLTDFEPIKHQSLMWGSSSSSLNGNANNGLPAGVPVTNNNGRWPSVSSCSPTPIKDQHSTLLSACNHGTAAAKEAITPDLQKLSLSSSKRLLMGLDLSFMGQSRDVFEGAPSATEPTTWSQEDRKNLSSRLRGGFPMPRVMRRKPCALEEKLAPMGDSPTTATFLEMALKLAKQGSQISNNDSAITSSKGTRRIPKRSSFPLPKTKAGVTFRKMSSFRLTSMTKPKPYSLTSYERLWRSITNKTASRTSGDAAFAASVTQELFLRKVQKGWKK
jgi:hypothetical protein